MDISIILPMFFMLLSLSLLVVNCLNGLAQEMLSCLIYFVLMIILLHIVIFLSIGVKFMNVEYLPLTRLVKAVKDGLPLDKLEEHFHCTIFGASIKMIYDGDYVIKAVGAFADTFYNRWTELSRDYRQDIQVKRFCDYVNWHLFNVSDMYGKEEF